MIHKGIALRKGSAEVRNAPETAQLSGFMLRAELLAIYSKNFTLCFNGRG